MRIIYSIKTALKALLIHRSRSALTILGIVIGITAIMLIASVGKGAQNLILGKIQGLGANVIVVVPGKEPKGPTDPSIMESILSDSLKMRDLKSLEKKSNVPTASDIIPVVFGVKSISYKGNTFRPTILGSSEQISKLFKLRPIHGSFFANDDVAGKASVVIIGSKVKNELFGASDAVGEKIRINKKNFRVIGVLPKKGQILFINFDESIVMPYTTAQEYIFGIKYLNRIIVQSNTVNNLPKTVYDIKSTLRENHNITNHDDDDFFVMTQEQIANAMKTVTETLTFFLAAVAAIALLVGGIGIMNIMLVSITERTKEIGLRKALGATNERILMQFLLESMALTTIGGLIGIFIGTLLSLVTASILTLVMHIDWAFSFPVSAALIGLIVSTIIGLVFGIYPARKAARKDPAQSLVYE